MTLSVPKEERRVNAPSPWHIVDHSFVDAVIQLPTNLFFGTTIQTCVMVLRKNRPDTGVLFINAERDFGHEGNKNKLRERIAACVKREAFQLHSEPAESYTGGDITNEGTLSCLI